MEENQGPKKPPYAPPLYEEMESLSDNDIKSKHDRIVSAFVNTSPINAANAFLAAMQASDFYRSELSRRESARQTEVMLEYTREMNKMTKSIKSMTKAVVVLSIVSALANGWSAYKASYPTQTPTPIFRPQVIVMPSPLSSVAPKLPKTLSHPSKVPPVRISPSTDHQQSKRGHRR